MSGSKLHYSSLKVHFVIFRLINFFLHHFVQIGTYCLGVAMQFAAVLIVVSVHTLLSARDCSVAVNTEEAFLKKPFKLKLY